MNRLTFISFALVCSTIVASAVSITNFGTANFTVDAGSTTSGFVTGQDADSISISGSDLGSALWGSFSPINLSSNWGNDIILSGSMTVTPASTFTIDLYDNDGDFATFSGGSWAEVNSGGQSSLSLAGTTLSGGGVFDNTQIFFLTLGTAGGGDTVTANLTDLSLVPEPSAYAAIAGLLALGWVMVRRRA